MTQKLKPEVAELYRIADGCLYFYQYRQYSLKEVIDAVEDLRVNANWINHYLPFAFDADQNQYLVVEPQGSAR